jgi:hypothetical protein
MKGRYPWGDKWGDGKIGKAEWVASGRIVLLPLSHAASEVRVAAPKNLRLPL